MNLGLEELVTKYSAPVGMGTNAGTDKSTWHSYVDTYARLFDPIRHEVTRVIELGVDSGASLCVFAEYFPNARVTGMDIDLSHYVFHHPRADLVQADATNPGRYATAADIIIDDASHKLEDQMAAIMIWGPLARKMMIVEDVVMKLGVDLAFKAVAEAVGMSCEIVDLRHVKGRFDDVLVILKPKFSL